MTIKVSRFPAPAFGGRRLRSTACKRRLAPLVPLALLDLPNRGRRVACGSGVSGSVGHLGQPCCGGVGEVGMLASPAHIAD